MSDTQFIDDVIEREEEVNQNIQAIAEELGLSKSELVTGASPAEQKRKAAKHAVFKTGGGPDSVLAEGLEEKAETAAGLVEQNAANSARLAREVGVSARDVAGSPGTTDAEEAKAELFTDGETSPDYDEMTVDEQKRAFFFGADGPPEKEANGWDRDVGSTSDD